MGCGKGKVVGNIVRDVIIGKINFLESKPVVKTGEIESEKSQNKIEIPDLMSNLIVEFKKSDSY